MLEAWKSIFLRTTRVQDESIDLGVLSNPSGTSELHPGGNQLFNADYFSYANKSSPHLATVLENHVNYGTSVFNQEVQSFALGIMGRWKIGGKTLLRKLCVVRS